MVHTAFRCLPLVLILLTACKRPAAPKDVVFSAGRVDSGTYVNDYFHLAMDIPEGWSVQGQQEVDELLTEGIEMATSDEAKREEMARATEEGTVFLLTMFRHPPGTQVVFNQSLMLLAEDLTKYPFIRKGSDYLKGVDEQLRASDLEYTEMTPMPTREYGGLEFDGMSVGLSTGGTFVMQDYLCAVSEGYALSVIISYLDEAQRDSVHAILRGMRSTAE
jgi:hypothetical protein